MTLADLDRLIHARNTRRVIFCAYFGALIVTLSILLILYGFN